MEKCYIYIYIYIYESLAERNSIFFRADKPVAGTASIGSVTLTPQHKGQISKNPNSLLNLNRSGGSVTISHQPKKFVGSPSSSVNHREPTVRADDLEDTEESGSNRRIYDDPQVHSLL